MTFVIAEAGVNHGGDFQIAKLLIEEAARAGADAVKFQAFNSQRLWGDSRIENLELDPKCWPSLQDHCINNGIEFMCTPFGEREVEFLAPLVRRMKVASGCLERFGLLAAVRATGLPAILSTGMADIDRIERAVDILAPSTLLHCTSAYPCPLEDANLAAMDALRARWGSSMAVGYSDHTQGIVIALAAVARGATVLEKHLTLDRHAEGPDHKASIEPEDFRIMVGAIRDIERAIGSPEKRQQPSEAATAKAWYG